MAVIFFEKFKKKVVVSEKRYHIRHVGTIRLRKIKEEVAIMDYTLETARVEAEETPEDSRTLVMYANLFEEKRLEKGVESNA